MNNIKILKKGIDVSSVLNNLKNNMDDWGIQKENVDMPLTDGGKNFQNLILDII